MKNLIPKRMMEYIIITFAVVLMDVGIYSDDVCSDQPGD